MKEAFRRVFFLPGREKILGLMYGVLIAAICVYPFPMQLRRLELPRWVWKWGGMAVAMVLFCVWLFLASRGKGQRPGPAKSFWAFVGMLLYGTVLAAVFRGDTSAVHYDLILLGGIVGMFLSLALIWREEKKVRDLQ